MFSTQVTRWQTEQRIGSAPVGTGSSFESGGSANVPNTIGALHDERTADSVAITVANGVQFGGALVPAGTKDKDSPALFFSAQAVRVWHRPSKSGPKSEPNQWERALKLFEREHGRPAGVKWERFQKDWGDRENLLER